MQKVIGGFLIALSIGLLCFSLAYVPDIMFAASSALAGNDTAFMRLAISIGMAALLIAMAWRAFKAGRKRFSPPVESEIPTFIHDYIQRQSDKYGSIGASIAEDCYTNGLLLGKAVAFSDIRRSISEAHGEFAVPVETG